MSATLHYLWIAKNQELDRIDWYLNTLVAAGIDCYADGSMVFVHPDQWDKACDTLLEAEHAEVIV
jgi:hypothetical protein